MSQRAAPPMSPTGRSRSRSFSNLQRALSGGTGFGVTDGGDEQQQHAAGEKPHSLWDQTFQDGTMARVIDKEMRAKRTHAQALVAASAIYHDRVNDHFSRTAVEELIPETSTARRKGLHRLDLGELAGAAMAGGATAEQIHDAVTSAEEQRGELSPLTRFRYAVSGISSVAVLLKPEAGAAGDGENADACRQRAIHDEWMTEVSTRFIDDVTDLQAAEMQAAKMRGGWFAGVGWALDPKCKFKAAWDVSQIFFLIYCAIFVPLRVCWEQVNEPWERDFILDLIVDIFFLLDLLLNCVTAYIRADTGKLEWQLREIVRNYLQSWFTIDLLSIIPINYLGLLAQSGEVAETDGVSDDLRAIKLLRFLRLIRLMRLAKVKRVMERYESLLGLINTFEFIKLVVMVFFVGHILACFWYLVGTDDHRDDGEVIDGWRTTNAMDNATYGEQYVTALYWSLTTMTTVGYGDISAYTTLEKISAVIAMLIGGFAFGLIVGSLTNIISASNPAETLRKARLSGKKTRLFEPFYTRNGHFTKTGSGQT